MGYFDGLQKALECYLNVEQIQKIKQAYWVAETAHEGQMRRSGEPYITHPVAAALFLANMRMDYQSIMATLLHDVIEDTPVTKEELTTQFGPEVAELVDGVSKLTQIKFESKAEAQAENFRKMVLAMVEDIRVIIVKLADRLHNMRTLKAMPAAKKHRIAIETLEIYAPIANRLGMHTIYTELEDLGFKALYPMRFRAIHSTVKQASGHRLALMEKIEHELCEALHQYNVPFASFSSRKKHLYSIYKKMRNKSASFSEVMDVYGFRIITTDIDNCYRALGAIHRTYKPLPERFKDYIGLAKANGYQALHTTLFGPFGVPIEVQIRTEEMDRVAINGIAAHWIYKSSGFEASDAQLKAREWVKSLLEMQNSTGSSLEFIENVKIDLFPEEVYVFTPQGELMELPRGATPVDFAYQVHSDIGNSCIAAKINRKLAPLSTPLANGQTVEIITAPGSSPNPAWLQFVVTGKARSNIRYFLKTQKMESSIALGKRLLTSVLEDFATSIKAIPEETMKALLHDLHYPKPNDLYYALGLGDQIPLLIARRLLHKEDFKTGEAFTQGGFAIKGTEGMAVHYAACCRPIPGDPIVGYLEAGRGIMIHLDSCLHIRKIESRGNLLSLCWDENVQGEFLVGMTVEVANQRGALATLASTISDAGANIDDVTVDPRDGQYNLVKFIISVCDKAHLTRVMRKLKAHKIVLRLDRQ